VILYISILHEVVY